jgi:hypothetical protein
MTTPLRFNKERDLFVQWRSPPPSQEGNPRRPDTILTLPGSSGRRFSFMKE